MCICGAFSCEAKIKFWKPEVGWNIGSEEWFLGVMNHGYNIGIGDPWQCFMLEGSYFNRPSDSRRWMRQWEEKASPAILRFRLVGIDLNRFYYQCHFCTICGSVFVVKLFSVFIQMQKNISFHFKDAFTRLYFLELFDERLCHSKNAKKSHDAVIEVSKSINSKSCQLHVFLENWPILLLFLGTKVHGKGCHN